MNPTETPPGSFGADDESPSIGALAAALAKAQGAMRAAAKDSQNPHFGSSYADLAAVWAACREPLTTNGLAVMQRVRTSLSSVTVVTMLVHSSGEWVRDTCVFPVVGRKGAESRTPQDYGSAITYARRYALAALVGVAAAGEDDDGNAASGSPPLGRQYEPPPRPAKPPPPPAVKPPEPKQPPALRARAMNVWRQAQRNGMTAGGFKEWAEGVLGRHVPSTDWVQDDVDRLEVALQEPPPPPAPPDDDVPF